MYKHCVIQPARDRQRALEEGLLQGSDGKLLPGNTVSRVETAVILQRYTEEY